jgi:hypothetical protein
MKKLVWLLPLLSIPSAYAESCGLTNLASCLPEKLYEFFLSVINAPLQPLLYVIKSMLENPPSINIFYSMWAIIVYCISLFYGILFIYSGFQFIFSGMNPIKRHMAKEWLKNTVVMITLIQASFYLYGLIVELGSIMSSAVLSMIDPHFFLVTADGIINIGLEFLFYWFYGLTLFFTALFLVLRYMVVAIGVIFAPIGIFCWFIPPLKSYGKLILNFLGFHIFIIFIDAIIILASSMLIDLPVFSNIKILVMISCFSFVNILFLILAWHSISKSAVADGGEKVAEAVKYIAMFM